jgi:hypothetical protein
MWRSKWVNGHDLLRVAIEARLGQCRFHPSDVGGDIRIRVRGWACAGRAGTRGGRSRGIRTITG